MEKIRIKYGIILTMGLFFITFIPGCWGNMDLTDIAIVSAIGFDKTEDGKYLASAQIFNPRAFRPEGGGGNEKNFEVVSKSGNSFNINFHTMYSEMPYQRFSATFEVYVIGEKLAREGVGNFLDIAQRRIETRFRSVILIARGTTAKEILDTRTPLTKNPSVQLIDSPQVNSLSLKKTLVDLIRDVEAEGKEAVIGVVEKKEERLIIQGAAVFKNETLAGWLNGSETRGYLFGAEKVSNIGFLVRNPLEPGNNITIYVNNSKSRLELKWRDQKPLFIIHVKAETTISEESGFFDFSKKENVDQIISASNLEIKKEIGRTIALAYRKYHCDIFGFGRLMEKYRPKYWKKVRKHWDQELEKLPVQISVKSELVGTGLIKNSLKPK